MEKIEITMNELSHYNSLKEQDEEHRKLIRKLQQEILDLKKEKNCSIPDVVGSEAEVDCDRCNDRPESKDNVLCRDCWVDLHGM